MRVHGEPFPTILVDGKEDGSVRYFFWLILYAITNFS